MQKIFLTAMLVTLMTFSVAAAQSQTFEMDVADSNSPIVVVEKFEIELGEGIPEKYRDFGELFSEMVIEQILDTQKFRLRDMEALSSFRKEHPEKIVELEPARYVVKGKIFLERGSEVVPIGDTLKSLILAGHFRTSKNFANGIESLSQSKILDLHHNEFFITCQAEFVDNKTGEVIRPTTQAVAIVDAPDKVLEGFITVEGSPLEMLYRMHELAFDIANSLVFETDVDGTSPRYFLNDNAEGEQFIGEK